MHSESSVVAWDDDSWDLFQSQFQFISGKSVDIGWFVEYLRDSNAVTEVVDLDELVRENQKYINSRKHLLPPPPPPPPNEIRKAKLRRCLQRARHHSSRIRNKSSSPSYSEKRPLETQTSVSRTRLLLSSGTRTPPVKVPQTASSGSPAKQESSEENSSYYKIKSTLRPVSLRTFGHVTAREDEVDNPTWGHPPLFTQNQVSPVHLNRVNSREKSKNVDWLSPQQKSADDDGDDDGDADDNENLNPLAVSELVSRFENVRRQGSFSISRNRRTITNNNATTDPIIRKGVNRHSYHGDTTGDRRNLEFDRNQWEGKPARDDRNDVDHDHLSVLTPTSTKNRQPLTRMKSEGNVLPRPSQLHLPPDQYSRLLMSEPRRVTKGLSLDTAGRDPYPVSRQSPLVSPRDSRGSQGTSTVVHLVARASTDVRRDKVPSRNHSLSSDAMTYVRPEKVVETPRWESEVEVRKKSSHSFVHSHRPPEQPVLPMIIGSIPEWKKQLMQKNREKHASNDQNVNQFTSKKTVTTTVNHTEPPWKTEFELIRRRQATHHGHHHHHHHHHQLYCQPMDHEWMKESHA